MFVLIWSLITDDNEYVVGPFPTREDSEWWANKYLSDDQKATWSVKRVTVPALTHSKRFDEHPVLAALEELAIDIDEVYDRR